MNIHLRDLGLQSITETTQRPGKDEIQKIESEFGAKLPRDYVEFLSTEGASLFTEDVVYKPLAPSPWAEDGFQQFDLFYGVSDDPGFDVLNELI